VKPTPKPDDLPWVANWLCVVFCAAARSTFLPIKVRFSLAAMSEATAVQGADAGGVLLCRLRVLRGFNRGKIAPFRFRSSAMDLLLAIALMLNTAQLMLCWSCLWTQMLAVWRPKNIGRRHSRIKPAQSNRRKPQWVVDAIIRLKALQPKASNRTTAAQFNRLYSASRCMTVSSSYVHFTVRDNQLAILRKRREIKAQKPSAPPCNAVWGIDMSGKFDTSRKLHMMLGVLDHGSRKTLTLVALPNKTSWTLLGHLCLAIGRYGRPRAIRTDNERVFTSGVFQLGLRIAGIRHQRIKAGCPWQNGRIERFFGTLKQSLDCWQVANQRQLQAALDAFRDWYCCIRPHARLDGATPVEAWQGIDPHRQKPVSIEWFEAWDGLLIGFRIRRR